MALQEYIARTRQILELSSPKLDKIHSAEEYRLSLHRSFQQIAELGQKNIQILETYLFPLLDPEAPLTEEGIESLRAFSALMIDATSMESVDLPLIYMQAERILRKAEESGDLREQILARDGMVIAAYMMFNLSVRLSPDRNDCFRYRDAGLDAAAKLLEHLPPEKFAALPDDECRELVLINSRYIRCLFEWDDKENIQKHNAIDLRLMRRSLALAEDPFYREIMPRYRWDQHVFRTLQYIADFTEYNNKHHFTPEQIREIYTYTQRLIDFLKTHPEFVSSCLQEEQDLYLARNSYLKGQHSLEEYRRELLLIMEMRNLNDVSARGMFVSFTAPLEYIYTLDPENLTPEQEETLRVIYREIAAYVYRMPKTGALSFMLTYLADFLKHYIAVPGGLSFQDICLQIMAAMHPPTYVHTLSVASITRYLTEQLLARQPELFRGVAGARTVEEVREKQDAILDFAYNAALLHDIGKLFLVETIITYGRSLVDPEWSFIRAHTDVGAALLSRFPETAEYAEIALGHQRWYDDSNGYPETFRYADAKYATIIALVEVADCLDAATDTIGRSYKKGLSLEEYLTELRAGRGTRYAPFVVDAFEDPAVPKALEILLTDGRDENYRNTYRLLKRLSSASLFEE